MTSRLGVLMSSLAMLGCHGMAAPQTVEPRYDAVKNLIQSERIRAIADLLPHLPASYRSHYTLVFESRSLQEASMREPRVVLYGTDATFVVSFNGGAEQRGSSTLDTMEFDPRTKTFVFREIVFPRDASEVVFSEDNPAKCALCHGTPARPIWDTYPLWPGVYGESDLAPPSELERQGLAEFARIREDHPRYGSLVDKPLSVLSMSADRYDGRRRLSPNAELGALLTRYNWQALVRSVASSPRFARYAYALLGALVEPCRNVELIPARVRASFAVTAAQFADETDRANERQQTYKRLRSHLPMSEGAGSREVVSLTRFRYLVEHGLGLPTDEWSLALERSTYDFRSLDATFAALLVEELRASEPAIGGIYLAAMDPSGRCEDLRRRSVARLDDGGTSPPSPRAAQPGGLQRCVTCHRQGPAPEIPFDRPDELAAPSRSGKYPHGSLIDEIVYRLRPEAGARRMPLGVIPSAGERAALEAYFRSLQAN